MSSSPSDFPAPDLSSPLWTTHRSVSWRIDVLDLNDQTIGELAYTGHDADGLPIAGGATGGSFSRSNARAVRGNGTLEMLASHYTPFPEWRDVRLRPFYQLHDLTGRIVEAQPVGTFIPAVPETTHGDGTDDFSIDLYDKLLIPHRRRVTQTYTASRGTVVTELVEALLQEAGERRLAITHSDETLRGPMSWDTGTTYLQVINDLLDSINYFSLWCDGWGRYRAMPYESPSARSVSWRFEDNRQSIYAHGWTHERDEFNVPNQVILISQPEDDEDPLVSVRTNDDPDSPYSTVNVGHVNPAEPEEGVEATSQRVLDEMAARRLEEVGQVTSTFTLPHLWVPLDLNSLVTIRHAPTNTNVRAVLQSDEFNMNVDALVQSRLRAVVS